MPPHPGAATTRRNAAPMPSNTVGLLLLLLVAGGIVLLVIRADRGRVSDVAIAPAPSTPRAPAALPSDGVVHIPGGTFLIGSPNGEGELDEHPQHQVSVAAFELDVTEVTVAAYSACVSAGQCSAAATDQEACNYGKSDKANHPINCVDWRQAATYCNAQGQRLPTEEEWEYAARAGHEGRTYSWGSAEPAFQLCWSGVSKREGTCSVGSFAKGAFGLADMTGNVWEWTSSAYSPYRRSPAKNTRVYRDGGWRNARPSDFRAAARDPLAPSEHFPVLGFRCAR